MSFSLNVQQVPLPITNTCLGNMNIRLTLISTLTEYLLTTGVLVLIIDCIHICEGYVIIMKQLTYRISF